MSAVTIETLQTINRCLSETLDSSSHNAWRVNKLTNHSVDLVQLDSILASLSADIPAGSGNFFDPFGQPTDDYWFAVILAGASLGSDVVKERLRVWSQTSDRYDDQGFEDSYARYDSSHPQPLGYGSLLKFARARGWNEAGQTYGATTTLGTVPIQPRFRLLDRQEIMALPTPQWLVKGIFPVCGIGAIYGPSGSGKSFLAFDMCCAIAEGKDWFGNKTKQTPVTYLMLEGTHGIKLRWKAWELEHNRQIPNCFRVCLDPFQIADPSNVNDICSVLANGSCVVIDTLNQAASGLDENSSSDMSKILQGAKIISDKIKGLVILIHHTGKDTSKGLRGHSSLGAAIDGSIEVKRSSNERTWKSGKVKDGPDDHGYIFGLKSHVLGQDADGANITSCCIAPGSEMLFRESEPTGEKQSAAHNEIRHALNQSKDEGKASAPATTKCLLKNDAINLVAETVYKNEQSSRRRTRAKAIIEKLVTNDFLHMDSDSSGDIWLWK